MLEKILEEIEAHAIEFETFGVSDDYISVGWVKDIIRKHINNENLVGGVDRSRSIDESRTRGWIPVEERLPEDGDSVLCTDGKYIYLTEYDADLDARFDDVDEIIAWQPLPEPYILKKGAKNENRNKIEWMDVVKKGVEDAIADTDFSGIKSDDFRDGFNYCARAVLRALEEMQDEEKFNKMVEAKLAEKGAE